MLGSLANRKAGEVQKLPVFGRNNQSYGRHRDTTNIDITHTVPTQKYNTRYNTVIELTDTTNIKNKQIQHTDSTHRFKTQIQQTVTKNR